MSETNSPPDDDRKRKMTRVKFLNREAAEVYLLLDFLSGRADRSLRPSSDEQGRSLLQDQLLKSTQTPSADEDPEQQKRRKDAEKGRQEIEKDLSDPTQLVLRTMRIKYPIVESDENFEANAAFLMRARDVLNTRAAPATGATIAFTSMLSGQRSKDRQLRDGDVTAWEFAETAYPWLMTEATKLAAWIRLALNGMMLCLILTLVVSAYTAWGKVMLDTLDAVRRDDGAVQLSLTKQPPRTGDTSVIPVGGMARFYCAERSPFLAPTPFDAACDIKLRAAVTHYQLAAWEWFLRWIDPKLTEAEDAAAEHKKAEQWATAVMTVLGNYVMPILYATLGSLAFVLRRYYDRLDLSLLSPRDRRAQTIRLLLGTLIGGCIGLVYSGSGAAQTTGTLGLAVTLSTSSIAFLAGYGVEGVFKALDGIIKQVFRVNGSEKPAQ